MDMNMEEGGFRSQFEKETKAENQIGIIHAKEKTKNRLT